MLKGARCSTPKCAMVKRNYPPGIHGAKGKKRLTGYGEQLQEKQKAKKIYNLLEKQFKLTFEKAKKAKGDVGENFLKMLETRFDNVIVSLGFAESTSMARQLINHGHFTINGKKVNIPSCQLKQGDIVKIKKSKINFKHFAGLKEKLKNFDIPGWLFLEKEDLSGKVLHTPGMADIKTNINIHMIVEYYSK